jgi:hypothetical protein
MAVRPGPRFPTFAGVRPPSAPKGPPVLGVGSRVVVTCRNGGSGSVTLTDDTGTRALATVDDGVEVEILAWRPRRGGDTRYRVASTTGGIEGWLGAANLQARQSSASPRTAGAAVLSGGFPSRTRIAPAESPRTRPSPAAKGVVPEVINRSGKSRRGARR